MRFPLRLRILLLTVCSPVALAVATLWTVNRSVTEQVNGSVHESLWRSSRVFEHTLAARYDKLAVTARVIVQDPRFFAALTLPGSSRDPHFRATVTGVARDFSAITKTDLFEVLDVNGALIASVGRASSTLDPRQALVNEARGKPLSRVLVEKSAHYQVTITPVLVEGRRVGMLLLGAQVGEELAQELRKLTHSEVTFVSNGMTTGSSFESGAERAALMRTLAEREREHASESSPVVLETRGPTQTYVTLIRRIPRSDAPGQIYVMQRSLDDETAYLSEMKKDLINLGVLAAVAAMLVGFFVSERITRPVQRLVRGAEEMERGNYEYPLDVKSRDEIGYLAQRFQQMRQRERAYVSSLEEVARMKSEFISVASHELRTPISVIRGYHELLAEGNLGPVTPQQLRALEAIDRSLVSLNHVAEDATRLAQVEGERLMIDSEEHDVATLVNNAIALATADAFERHVEVEAEVPRSLDRVLLDGVRVTQAIEALVRNGIRFTPDGGRVTVEARRENEWLVIEVRDTGIGIPAERQGQLFEHAAIMRDSLHHHSSHTLEFNSGGLGLGLSIVRGVSEAHGGGVSVESAPGRGSLFTIRIPYRRSPENGRQKAA